MYSRNSQIHSNTIVFVKYNCIQNVFEYNVFTYFKYTLNTCIWQNLTNTCQIHLNTLKYPFGKNTPPSREELTPLPEQAPAVLAAADEPCRRCQTNSGRYTHICGKKRRRPASCPPGEGRRSSRLIAGTPTISDESSLSPAPPWTGQGPWAGVNIREESPPANNVQ